MFVPWSPWHSQATDQPLHHYNDKMSCTEGENSQHAFIRMTGEEGG